MKKTLLLLITLGILFALSACRSGAEGSLTSTPTSASAISESTQEPTSTPIPTYVSGTELYGMLSVTGEVVIEPQYEYLDLFSDEGLARFEDHGLWGFVNENGEEVILAQYEDANNFSEGLAAVKVDGLYGFIDTSGEIVIEPQFEGVQDGFAHKRCVVLISSKWGIIDNFGKVVVDPKFEEISLYCEEYLITKDSDGLCSILNREGIAVVSGLASPIYAVTDSGYYFVKGSDIENLDSMFSLSGERYYVKDYHQRWLLFAISSDSIIPYSTDGSSWGLMDLSVGGYSINCMYDEVWYTPGNLYAVTYKGEPVDFSYYRPGIEYTTSVQGTKGMLRASDGYETLECENLYCEEQFGYILYEDADGKWCILDPSGNRLSLLDGKQVVCSSNENFAESLPACVYDVEGHERWQNSDIVIMSYMPSIECWTYYMRENSDQELPNLGFISSDGYFISDDIYGFGQVNYPQTEVNLPRQINPEMFPIIARNIETLQNELITSDGHNNQYIIEENSIYIYKGVIVIRNEDGLEGILSYDGKLIIEPSQYSFVLDDIYDDSDYLIYTVISK